MRMRMISMVVLLVRRGVVCVCVCVVYEEV